MIAKCDEIEVLTEIIKHNLGAKIPGRYWEIHCKTKKKTVQRSPHMQEMERDAHRMENRMPSLVREGLDLEVAYKLLAVNSYCKHTKTGDSNLSK